MFDFIHKYINDQIDISTLITDIIKYKKTILADEIELDTIFFRYDKHYKYYLSQLNYNVIKKNINIIKNIFNDLDWNNTLITGDYIFTTNNIIIEFRFYDLIEIDIKISKIMSYIKDNVSSPIILYDNNRIYIYGIKIYNCDIKHHI